jgi:hypothetical protein
MELASTAINAAVVATVGIIVAWLTKGRIDALERRMNDRFAEMDRRFDQVERRVDRVEERFDRRMDGFQTSLDAMRKDLTQIALAVGVRLGPEGAA